MTITLQQINPTPGDIEGNSKMIVDAVKAAAASGSDLIVFPELAVTGYPPQDLLERKTFIDDVEVAVSNICSECRGIAAIVGAPVRSRAERGKPLFNSALFIREGKVEKVINKTLLPSYDVFDETRYFEPATEADRTVELSGKKIAVTICEDIWADEPPAGSGKMRSIYTVDPVEQLKRGGHDLHINIAALPFSHNRIAVREEVMRRRASQTGMPLIMVSQCGGNGELLYDGSSLALSPEGKIVNRLPLFKESSASVTLDSLINAKDECRPLPPKNEMVLRALVAGVRDYCRKSGNGKVIMGLSGGIDSAVTAVIATLALGRDNVTGILMPSRYSSDHSISDAYHLAHNLGISYHIVSIEETFRSFEMILNEILDDKPDTTEENIQARIRAIILMAWANKKGGLVLNTSNKSETAVGYGTLYGDMAGALSVPGDLYKTELYDLARYINRDSTIIPAGSLTKPPSAELKSDQCDQDTLPPYDLLDEILFRHIEMQENIESIASRGFDRELVRRVITMLRTNEHKRYQAAPTLRVSVKAFGSGRRIPLVSGYRS